MGSNRYTEEFKIEVVKQVIEHGFSVTEVAERLGATTKSIYTWLKLYGESIPDTVGRTNDQAEIARLKMQLQRVTEERDLLKKAAAHFAKQRD